MSEGGVTGVRHTGVAVRDLDRALRFYRDALGLEVIFEGESESPHLAAVTGQPVRGLRKANVGIPGGPYFELLEWKADDLREGAARPVDWGSGHTCLMVDDIDAVLARLRDHGFPAWVEEATRIPS
ncbi:MAG TPA: VOC family protein, partial [Solirubrobacterales bacterium]|nr:VOC family protein [Solirubrobacterales bacterium]